VEVGAGAEEGSRIFVVGVFLEPSNPQCSLKPEALRGWSWRTARWSALCAVLSVSLQGPAECGPSVRQPVAPLPAKPAHGA
jgi:hypothetical protein